MSLSWLKPQIAGMNSRPQKSVVTVGNLRVVLRGTPFNLLKFEGISWAQHSCLYKLRLSGIMPQYLPLVSDLKEFSSGKILLAVNVFGTFATTMEWKWTLIIIMKRTNLPIDSEILPSRSCLREFSCCAREGGENSKFQIWNPPNSSCPLLITFSASETRQWSEKMAW